MQREPTIHGTPWMLGLGRAALGLDPTYDDRQRLTAMLNGFLIVQTGRDL